MEQVYRNTRWGRVRFLQFVFWATATGFAWLAWSTRGGNDPANNHLAALILTPILVLSALGMEFYLRLYVTAIYKSAQTVTVETLATIGRTQRSYPLSDISFGRERRTNPRATLVTTGFYLDNSWSTMKVLTRKWSYIIDTTED
jgi:TMEM70/TMEM186/TMEM223 protein family